MRAVKTGCAGLGLQLTGPPGHLSPVPSQPRPAGRAPSLQAGLLMGALLGGKWLLCRDVFLLFSFFFLNEKNNNLCLPLLCSSFMWFSFVNCGSGKKSQDQNKNIFPLRPPVKLQTNSFLSNCPSQLFSEMFFTDVLASHVVGLSIPSFLSH